MLFSHYELIQQSGTLLDCCVYPPTGCCQTNPLQSKFAAKRRNVCGTNLALLGKSSGPVKLEVIV